LDKVVADKFADVADGQLTFARILGPYGLTAYMRPYDVAAG
jgi:hypothetical protein